MNDITVTTVVATYNRAHLLPQSLDSLLAQSRPIDEIIVIDDASSDHTAQVMQPYLNRVRYVRNLENSGQGASLNFGISLANSTYIWLFDDDDLALPDSLENHIAYLSANPNVDFSYSDKYVFNGDGDIWQRHQWRIDPLPAIDPKCLFERTLYSMNTLLPGMLVPVHCYRTSGVFDVSLDRCLDHELLLRLSHRFRSGNMGKPSFVYREHGGARGSGAHQHQAHERFRVMLDYRQQMFKRIRCDYSLDDFTPQFCRDHSLTTAPGTLALLQRGCVMLHHGLVEEALTDLGEALSFLSPADHDNIALREMLSRATNVEAWIWPNAAQNLTRIAQLLAATDTLSLNAAFARGLYWQARSAHAKGERIASARLVARMGLFMARCGYYRGFGSKTRFP